MKNKACCIKIIFSKVLSVDFSLKKSNDKKCYKVHLMKTRNNKKIGKSRKIIRIKRKFLERSILNLFINMFCIKSDMF